MIYKPISSRFKACANTVDYSQTTGQRECTSRICNLFATRCRLQGYGSESFREFVAARVSWIPAPGQCPVGFIAVSIGNIRLGAYSCIIRDTLTSTK